jgi:hypothetical protein
MGHRGPLLHGPQALAEVLRIDGAGRSCAGASAQLKSRISARARNRVRTDIGDRPQRRGSGPVSSSLVAGAAPGRVLGGLGELGGAGQPMIGAIASGPQGLLVAARAERREIDDVCTLVCSTL